MPDIAIDPALAEEYGSSHGTPIPSASGPASPSGASALANPLDPQGDAGLGKPEGEPRLSHARMAVPDDPSIRPYGCNSPRCVPSIDEYEAARTQFEADVKRWRADFARLQADPATAGQRPPARHPTLASIGICFSASRDLLDHLRDEHQMRQKGEVHVSQLAAEAPGHNPLHELGELGEDGKMFRCALIGCQRTWKNANGLQYHCLTSVTAEEHNIDTVNRRRPPVKRKADDSIESSAESQQLKDGPVHYCPYREKLNCQKSYKHKGGVKHHLEQVHKDEPDYETQMALMPGGLPGPVASASVVTPPPVPIHPQPAKKHKPNPPVPAQRSAAPSRPAVPQSGMYTHGYIFSHDKQPYRPRNRPVDALYYLNILATSGIKTHQARASERLLVNALLNADFIRGLQDTANTAGYGLELFDEDGMVAPPEQPLRFPGEDKEMPFTKGDMDRAVLKLAGTLQHVGFGDVVDTMEGIQ